MEKYIEYAPIIVVIIGFFTAYKVFVTPVQMEKELSEFEHRLESKFVLKETHNIAVSEMKADIAEIKDKIDKIYEKLMTG
jgi:septation ring formation regulator EzrA